MLVNEKILYIITPLFKFCQGQNLLISVSTRLARVITHYSNFAKGKIYFAGNLPLFGE